MKIDLMMYNVLVIMYIRGYVKIKQVDVSIDYNYYNTSLFT